jgi:hypothetical protein
VTDSQFHNQETSTPVISYSTIQGSGRGGVGWVPALGVDGGGRTDADPLAHPREQDQSVVQPDQPIVDRDHHEQSDPAPPPAAPGQPGVASFFWGLKWGGECNILRIVGGHPTIIDPWGRGVPDEGSFCINPTADTRVHSGNSYAILWREPSKCDSD